MIYARFTVVLAGALTCATGLGGCDNSSSPGAGKAPTTPQNPSSVYGKTVKMAKDVKTDIEQTSEQAHQAANVITNTGNFTEIAGMKWPVPAGWEAVKASGMRIAEYNIPGGINARFFALGGDVDANISRWRGQVSNQIVKESTEVINAGALKIHTIAMTGTYAGMGAGGVPGAPQEGTRFLGAIVQGGPQSVQVVLTGPWQAVEEIEKAWGLMLAGIQAK